MGNPTTYTQDKADEICQKLGQGIPLAVICREEGMPAVRTVNDWRRAHPDFDKAYGEARDEGFDVIAADTLAIVDAPPERCNTEHGDKIDAGHVAWTKNRIEQRLKLLAKWDPRRYGELQKVEHSGSVEVSLAERMRKRGPLA